MLSTEAQISRILYFIEKKEETEETIAEFRAYLSELAKSAPITDILVGFYSDRFMSLVGFCFYQDSIKMRFINSILDIDPNLLIRFGESKAAIVVVCNSIPYVYALKKAKDNGQYTLRKTVYHSRVSPLCVAVQCKSIAKVNAVLSHPKRAELIKPDIGYIWCIISYTSAIIELHTCKEEEEAKEILAILQQDAENLTCELGKQSNLNLFNERIEAIHQGLSNIDSWEICQELYEKSSSLITAFYKGYLPSLSNIFSNCRAINTHDEFCKNIISQRKIENHVIKTINFIEETEESEDNIKEFKLLLKEFGNMRINIEDIAVWDLNFCSLAVISSAKPKFLDCIITIAPILLIKNCNFRHLFVEQGTNQHMRLVLNPEDYKNYGVSSLPWKAIEHTDLPLIKAIISNPLFAKALRLCNFSFIEWKFSWYVRAFDFFYTYKSIYKERDEEFLQVFDFEGIVRHMLTSGETGRKGALGSLINWIPGSYLDESKSRYAVLNHMVRPLATTFLLGRHFSNIAPQVITILAISNRQERGMFDCFLPELFPILIDLIIYDTVKSYKKQPENSIEPFNIDSAEDVTSYRLKCMKEVEEAEALEANDVEKVEGKRYGLYVGGALILGLSTYAIWRCLSQKSLKDDIVNSVKNFFS